MIQTDEQIALDLDRNQSLLNVSYTRKTSRTIFDICDLNGRIIKTGKLEADEFSIAVPELAQNHYIFLILDGDQIVSRKFCIEA